MNATKSKIRQTERFHKERSAKKKCQMRPAKNKTGTTEQTQNDFVMPFTVFSGRFFFLAVEFAVNLWSAVEKAPKITFPECHNMETNKLACIPPCALPRNGSTICTGQKQNRKLHEPVKLRIIIQMFGSFRLRQFLPSTYLAPVRLSHISRIDAVFLLCSTVFVASFASSSSSLPSPLS